MIDSYYRIELVFFLILLFTSSPTVAGSDTFPQWNAERVYSFGRALEAEGEYYRAITEYKRILFFWPDTSQAQRARYHMGLCYLSGKRYHAAEATFRSILSRKPASGACLSVFSRYALSEVLYRQERYDAAERELVLLSEAARRYIKPFSIIYARMWCHIEGGNRPAVSKDLADASRHLPEPESRRLRENVRSVLDCPRKKPWLAGTLSTVLPGSGQLYAERWRDGLLSMVINGLFIGGIIHAAKHDHEETAFVLGFFELGWYSANIYNAVNDAHKYNRDQWQRHLHFLQSAFGLPFNRHTRCPDEP